MSGDRTAPPWLWLLLDVPTLSIRDRQNRNVERRHKLYVALPLTCLCLCCRRLLFHLCVVIQAARWDESTATSSSNYFAVKTHRIAWKKKKKVGSSLIPVSHGVPQFPVARACASLSGNNASFVFTFAHEKKTAPSHPAMISHIAALLLCGSQVEAVACSRKTPQGVCVSVFERDSDCVCIRTLQPPTPPHTSNLCLCVSVKYKGGQVD